ncbi:hypothetical protein DC3_11930 [Deinococcus cellulosilyticus NBRC 106333 = KACC 11606]|uniref:histidine kinase n=1 Tax=Deinococcus cellulosilyticus (strain DSM 18568 / NBRC 106333 / KACC 11606 / 5516J-15) TaxID=1223518 RepID=A0A511MZ34_DEIC1|nr:hypothetical protein DC3_11930 [Deinococcus cellulosilyticus NBRC 106333 = KACC 11606]
MVVENSVTLQAALNGLMHVQTAGELSEVILQHSRPLLGTVAATVMLLNGDQLEVMTYQGLTSQTMKAMQRFPVAAPLPASEVVRTHKPLFFESREAFWEAYPHLKEMNLRSQVSAMAYCPIPFEDQTLGVIMFGFEQPRTFATQERVFMATLAQQSGQALERLRLQQCEKLLTQQREEAFATLQSMMDHVPIGVALLDTDLRFRMVNPALARSNHQSISEHLGQRLSDLFPQAGPHLEAHMRKVMDTGEPLLNLEISGKNVEGMRKDLTWLCSYYPVRTPEGQLLGIGCTVQDITALKVSEQKLQESQHFLQRIADTMPTVLYLNHLHEGRIMYANRHIQEILGYTPEEITQMPVQDLVASMHPDELAQARAHHQQLMQLQDGETIEREYRLRDRGGSWHWLYSRQTIFSRDADGRPLMALTGAVDITERKLSEQAFMESDFRFQRIADRAPVMIWMSGLQQETTFLNQVWLDYTGRSREEDLGYGWFSLVHPDDLNHCAQVCKQAYADVADFEMEFRMLRHDGVYRWLVNRGIRRFTPDGQFQGFIGACIDIHDRKMAEAALQDSEKRLLELMDSQKRFVADAAHELRNPLTAIQGNMDLLVRFKNIPEEEKRDIIRDVQKEANRLSRLVHDMLQLARGDAGAALHEDHLELHEVLLEAFRDIERMSPKHTLKLEGLCPTELIGDADRLKQVGIILLENAVKYTPPGGEITLSLNCEADQAVIRVKDNGMGISAEDLPRVFERFFRADRSRYRGEDPGGTGLGLPIARWIVEGHGGEIHLESEPGVGTTAVVRLPISLEE